MDHHLNLFYSYAQGNLTGPERTKQLEDNITRALVVTVSGLRKQKQKQFLKEILGDEIHSTNFEYDLQNTDKYEPKVERNKFLLVLQRHRSGFTLDKIGKSKPDFLENDSEQQKKRLEAEIKGKLIAGEEWKSQGGIVVSNSKLNSILQLLHNNRPDGWIIGEKEAILIETKIGSNSVSEFQLYRHINGKDGYRVRHSEINNKNPSLKLVDLTWDEICDSLNKVKEDSSDRESFLISQLLEYISMTGQILNLDYLVKGEFEYETNKEQFLLFLEQLDLAIKQRQLIFTRKGRPKSELWDWYAIPNENNQLSLDPHYTVGFWGDRVSIELTIKNTRKINNSFASRVAGYFEEKKSQSTSCSLSRYYVRQQKYRLVDHRPGQIKGEYHQTFDFYAQFGEIGNHINSISDSLVKFSQIGIYKQFDLGYQVKLFNFDKIRDSEEPLLRAENKLLLENPQKLIQEFADFMEETSSLFEALR